MASNYLIGRGELLTYPIDAPKRSPGEKKYPYSLNEAKSVLLPQITEAIQTFKAIPEQAFPHNLAVARIALHPSFIAKSYFPKLLLNQAGLTSVGSKTLRIQPRRTTKVSSSPNVETTEIFVAGQLQTLENLPHFINDINEEMPISDQLRELEFFQPMLAADRLRIDFDKEDLSQGVFEVGLHYPPDETSFDLRSEFVSYASLFGFQAKSEFIFTAGRLMFLAIEGDPARLQDLANFSLVRVIRVMPKIRRVTSVVRAQTSTKDPDENLEPISKEPRVAILDGGLPSNNFLDRYIRKLFDCDGIANDVPDYNEHGLGVTSAFLFGSIDPQIGLERPYSYVDHHRVLDSETNKQDQYELYKTLGHIETVLLSRQYQFVNLSLGPDLPIEDQDVHAWTAVIDSIISDGETLLSVAAGNNGERDSSLSLNRIQVPADSVNVMSVGASDSSDTNWTRASYSAVGPGRSPGRRKPDLVAFGGKEQNFFNVFAPGSGFLLNGVTGTSFSSPLALRTAVGVRATLGSNISPLAIKALMIHSAELSGHNPLEVGWGKIPNSLGEIIYCDEGVARIIYQGELKPGKFLRAPVPLPEDLNDGKVTIKATFCYASPVDPQDSSAYTKAGLLVTFRPHKQKKKEGAANAESKSFFPSSEYRPEDDLRADLGKWETTLHAENNFMATSLSEPVFDVHYNAREFAGAGTGSGQPIRYALIVTVIAAQRPTLYQDILTRYSVLQPIIPEVEVPVRVEVST